MVSNSKGDILYSPSRDHVTVKKKKKDFWFILVAAGRTIFNSITSLTTDHFLDPNFRGKTQWQPITSIPTSSSILMWTLEPSY